MKLSIIIPYSYKETFEILTKSIDTQIKYNREDVEIIIINDTNEIIKYWDKVFKTPKPKSWPWIARNIWIEKASWDYIMFVDNDNIFTDVLVFNKVLNCIENNKNENYIIFWNLAEDEYGLYPSYHYTQWTIFNRNFLLLNDIKFLPQFRAEDMYFDSLVREHKWIDLKSPIIINRLHDKSIIALNKEKDKIAEIHFDCMCKIFERIQNKIYRDICFTIHFVALLKVCIEADDYSIIDLDKIRSWEVKINNQKLLEFVETPAIQPIKDKILNYILLNKLN